MWRVIAVRGWRARRVDAGVLGSLHLRDACLGGVCCWACSGFARWARAVGLWVGCIGVLRSIDTASRSVVRALSVAVSGHSLSS
eukprot:2099869-Alexandrium_andersonii.AAC.1